MNKKDLPLIQLQSLNRLNVQLSKLGVDNDGLIIKTYNEKKLIRFDDNDSSSNFKFELVKLEFPGNTPIFNIDVSPSSQNSNSSLVKRLNEKQVIGEFQQWISWLKVFDKSHLTPEEEFLKNYQEEFYSEFEIIDEDANTSTFSTEQQILIDKYLNYMEVKLLPESKQNEEINEIVEDIKLLRGELGKTTKKKIVTEFSKIFARLRKSSIKLLGEFYEAGKKELFKRLISGGLDELTGLM
ncbi:hypothetical protein GCM10011344_38560 [Dokdonia pacifica]|uniref:Uncharacterized protein n=1 Tax=Dokdonia pacifica TaxID=1627892 RepID=A0A238ZYG1_9FLAO|nr:hypothetical protein [Dokdonia pacifica]GGG34103.1 hypothetical protein GCM10011344_38560 [Dokdonia pacifica]SNR88476.1 hypothetical protein SAMN06265376_10432 [Dokdonia pacifica]